MPRRTRSSGAAKAKSQEPTPDHSNETDDDAPSPPAQDKHVGPEDSRDRGTGSLIFNEQLAAKPGKPIPLSTLLERLSRLSNELKSLEQGENETMTPDTFADVATQLAHHSLLGHKDRGVRAFTAQCIVDVLRLSAPDAPFSGQQLKAIFEMIVRQILPAVGDLNDAYNSQYLYILDSLATVKSIVLITDLDSADRLVVDVFTTFFDTLSDAGRAGTGETIGKSVEYHMLEILVLLVDEASAVPPAAVEIVMAQFLRLVDPRRVKALETRDHDSADYRQTTLKMTSLPPAYNLAKQLCNTCANKMAREVGQYFSDIISAAADLSQSRGSERDLDDDANLEELEEEEFEQLKKAHRLLKELWRASPLMLQNVIPSLEAELGVGNTTLRLLATETIGDMVAGVGSTGLSPVPRFDPAQFPPNESQEVQVSSFDSFLSSNTLQPFIQTHPTAYATFLKRWQDKNPTIRASWTACIGRILATSAGGIGLGSEELERLLQSLARMMNDSDERVRQAAVAAVGAMSTQEVILKFGTNGGVDTPGSVLGNLSERIKDKKASVRREAMRTLAMLWSSASHSIAEGEDNAVKLLGGIVSKILNTLYTNDPEIMALVDEVLFEILVPLGYPQMKTKSDTKGPSTSQTLAENSDANAIRARRILLLASSLDEKAKKIFFSLGQRQAGMMRYLSAYIQGCEQYNGGVSQSEDNSITEKLSGLIDGIAKTLPSSSRAASELWKFATAHDKRCYYLIRFCMNHENDYKSVVRAIKECLKRMTEKGVAQAGKNETFKILLLRVSILFYNKSHLPAMLQASKEIDAPFAKIADEIVRDVSLRVPEVLKTNVSEICKSVQDHAPKTSSNVSKDLRAAEDLKTLAAFAKKFPSELSQDKHFQQSMLQYCLLGVPSKCAKYACKIAFLVSTRKELLARDLLAKCLQDLTYGETGFLARMATIAQISLLSPSTLDGHVDAIFTFAIQEVLNKTRAPSDAEHTKPLWEAEMDAECEAKCWALKMLVNLIRSSDVTMLAERAPPVYTLLKTIVINEGELSLQGGTPPAHKARLRLLAAISLVKLSRSQSHDALLNASTFNKLAEVVQDPLFEIRSGFVSTIEKYLASNRIPRRFYTVLFLLAWEPVVQFRTQSATWIRARVAAVKNLVSHPNTHENDHATQLNTIFEGLLPRLLSLLAHHPDFGDTTEDLLELSKYLVFYLTTVSSKDNISLIYHLALQVKNHVDVISSTKQFVPDDVQADYTQRLHVLSDLATITCRSYAEIQGWNIQTLPIKAKLPQSLFLENKDHASSLQTAETFFIPETLPDQIEALIRTEVRKSLPGKLNGLQGSRKRKLEGKDSSAAIIKKPKRAPERNSRKSNNRPRSLRNVASSDDEDSRDQTALKHDEQSRRRSTRVQQSNGQVQSYTEASDSDIDMLAEDAEDGASDSLR